VELSRAFGRDARIVDDGAVLVVRGSARPLRSDVHVRTDGDHRIAMAAHVVARALGVALTLDVPGCEATSFPGFLDALDEVARAH
jgi:5-enolpyruvylshikimate-3-phosphate synthase